jgi:peroxiredoxin
MHALWFSLATLALGGAPDGIPAAPVGTAIEDFTLHDHRGAEWRLGDRRERLVVLAFVGADCPLAKLYAPRLAELARAYGPRGVAFAGVNSNAQDGVTDVARYARTHELPLPVLKDVGNALADRLGAARTPEVFVLDEYRVVRYRGRVDDQYGVGVQRPAATRRDLAEALDELLAGRPVSVPATEPAGCWIGRASKPGGRGEVTYTRDVAPVLQRHCQSCHRPGQVAPFSLTSYQDAAGWGEMIREVVSQGRMPPWHADPRYGQFRNDRSLSAAEKEQILAWVDGGCPEGDPADLPPAPTFSDEWQIGTPDVVLEMAEPFRVPAEGTIEYQLFEVDPGFRAPTWVRAAEVRPGNRAVVHHVTVFLKPPGAPDVMAQGRLGSYCLAAYAVGTPPTAYPDGMAKLVPPGWHVVFVIHYQAVGSPQTDRTRLGLILADPRHVRREVATHLLYDPDLCIPPHAADHVVTKSWCAEADVLLVALFPHMHLRGRSFRYEAVYPDGREEILLDVPRYDFGWQDRYELAEPKRLPAGTVVRCTAHYDNSAGNPANPDPSATVRTGTQSWEEMFNGYIDFALADQDMTRADGGVAGAVRRAARWGLLVLTVSAAVGFVALRRFARRAAGSVASCG